MFKYLTVVALFFFLFMISSVSIAADKPAAPSVLEVYDLHDHTAYVYKIGNALCIAVLGSGSEKPVSSACFRGGRSIEISEPTEIPDGYIYAFTVDVELQIDPICSIVFSSGTAGGVSIACTS